jgi:hypothetical protein
VLEGKGKKETCACTHTSTQEAHVRDCSTRFLRARRHRPR